MSLLLKIMGFYSQFQNLVKNNPMVAGAVSLWGLGVITYFVRDIPRKIVNFIYGNFTTSVTVNTYDEIFKEMDKFVTKHTIPFTVRSLNMIGSYDDEDNEARVTSGYGSYWIWYSGSLIKIHKSLEEKENNTYKKKETIYLMKFGRSKKIFYKIFDEIKIPEKYKDDIKVYSEFGSYEGWGSYNYATKRPLNTLYIPKDQIDRMLSHIKLFLENKQWFIDKGIPWRTGLLLEGPPGTGKTTIVKVLASHFDLNIYKLNSFSKRDIEKAISTAPKKSIILLEDIDVLFSNEKRDLQNDTTKEDSKPVDNATSLFGKDNLSDLLNAIDGVGSDGGKIIIATTNDISKLDKALIREGRFNLIEHIGYIKIEQLQAMLDLFYGKVDLSNRTIKENLTPAKVQAFIMENIEDPQNVIDKTTNVI